MPRILLIGVGPRPHPGSTKIHAPGLRLQTFAETLGADGHEVSLAEFDFGGGGAPQPSAPLPEGVIHAQKLRYDGDKIEPPRGDGVFDGIVALTDIGGISAILWDAPPPPLFVDWFGHPMAERQMQGAVHGNSDALHLMWGNLLPLLFNADAFGACSAAQRHALWGELGAVGRMNHLTCGRELVHVLKPALPFREPFLPTQPGFLRGRVVPADARIILSTGGFNTWLDEETLFRAADQVLDRDPRAHFVATGGAIPGHVERVFHKFQERVAASPRRDRFHLLGWVSHEAFVDCCLEADAGATCDLPTLEGEFGCRNRLFGWLWAGMRAVAADASELTADLARLGLVETAPLRNPDALAERLAGLLERGRCDEQEAERQRALLLEHFHPARCYQPLRDWAANPQRAPDAGTTNALRESYTGFFHRQEAGKELAARLEGSRLFRLIAKPEWKALLRQLR